MPNISKINQKNKCPVQIHYFTSGADIVNEVNLCIQYAAHSKGKKLIKTEELSKPQCTVPESLGIESG